MAQPSTEHWLTPQRNTGSHPAQYASIVSVLPVPVGMTTIPGSDRPDDW
ncbi:TPA: hypothetical protein ACLNUI_003754 [Vibrio cholerae O1]